MITKKMNQFKFRNGSACSLLSKLPEKVKNTIRMSTHAFKASCVTMKKPIFIWGTGRSGTHLLYDILSLHPDLCFVNTKHRWKKGLWGDMHHGDTTPHKLKGYPIPVEGMSFNWQPAGIIPRFYGILTKDCILKINTGKVINNYKKLDTEWRWKRSNDKKYRILDKTPAYIMMVELINAIFPDSFHIFCIRDPRAVVNSILRVARFTGNDSYEKEYMDGFFANMYPDGYEKLIGKSIVEILCWQVEQLIKIGFDYWKILGDRLIPFRYEKLINDAHSSVAYLFNKAKLFNYKDISRLIPNEFRNYSPEWPQKGAAFSANKNICFGSEELNYFDRLLPLVQNLGYDDAEVGKIAGTMNIEGITK